MVSNTPGMSQGSIPVTFYSAFSLMLFSILYKRFYFIFATLLMIIHYIPLRIISKKLKLFERKTLSSYKGGFMKITWS